MNQRRTVSTPLRVPGILTEHVFSDKLATGRPDADDLAQIHTFGIKAAEKITSLTEIPAPIAVRGDDPVGPYYTPLGTDGKPAVFLKAKPVTDLEKCTGCGICATVCPMGSIPADAPDTCTGICIMPGIKIRAGWRQILRQRGFSVPRCDAGAELYTQK